MYGHCNAKWLYISCIIIFEVGSAVCGAAPSMDALIVGRAICGLGGTGMYTGVLYVFPSTPWANINGIQDPTLHAYRRARASDVFRLVGFGLGMILHTVEQKP